jgi:hypothetical protein
VMEQKGRCSPKTRNREKATLLRCFSCFFWRADLGNACPISGCGICSTHNLVHTKTSRAEIEELHKEKEAKRLSELQALAEAERTAGGSNAYALFNSPRLGGNLFCVSTWESVFPKGGSHEVRAKCAVTGASDAHND